MILNWPCSSVDTVRTFSMRAGLAASTVTPGRTAPDVSRTTPAMPLAPVTCADAKRVTNIRHARAVKTDVTDILRIAQTSSNETGSIDASAGRSDFETASGVLRAQDPLFRCEAASEPA